MEETDFSNSCLLETEIKAEVFVEPLILLDEPGVETATVMSLGDSEVLEQCKIAEENAKIKPFICPICGKEFGRNSHLKRHVKIHDKKKGSKFLDTPSVGGVNTSDFHHDTSLSTSGRNLRSAKCKSSVDANIFIDVLVSSQPSDELILEEGSTVIGEDPLETRLCGDTSDDMSEPSERRSHSEKKFFCKFCGKALLRKKNLKRHEKLHEGSELHVCNICGKQFGQISYLKSHVKTVHERVQKLEKIFECTDCDKSFGRMSHLRRHMKLHLGGPTFNCEICGKGFLQKGNLKAHVQMVHSQEKTFECNICNKMFPLRSNLNMHMRIHTGEKPFVCGVCGWAFPQSNQLKAHARTHSRKKTVQSRVGNLEKIYNCVSCSKSFGRMSHLKRHMKLHSEEPTFNCEVCGKGFRQKGNLKAHTQIVHSKEKTFECRVCKKWFPQQSNLRTHMRIHTGEKPFVCSLCGTAFTQSNHLKIHMKTHSGEKSYPCSVCGRQFSKNQYRLRHEVVHSQEPLTKKIHHSDKNKDDDIVIFQNSDTETNEQLEVDGVPISSGEETDDVKKEFNEMIEDVVKEEPEFDGLHLDDECS